MGAVSQLSLPVTALQSALPSCNPEALVISSYLHLSQRLYSEHTSTMEIKVVLLTVLLCFVSQASPSRLCYSDRDCPGFQRDSCASQGPNFLLIFPTCKRRKYYNVAGRCLPFNRCADCLASRDCVGSQQCRSGR